MIFAIMEYSLARLLRWQHANFEQIGESVDYYGMRTPFAIEPHKLIEETKETDAVSCYYLKQFSQPGGSLDQFLAQCPYINAKMLSFNACVPVVHRRDSVPLPMRSQSQGRSPSVVR